MEGYNIDEVEVLSAEDNFGHLKLSAMLCGNQVGKLEYILYCNTAFILNISVIKKFRHLGIGSKLLMAFDKQCIDNKVVVAEGLFSPFDEKTGREFYTKNGYSIIKDVYKQQGLKPIDIITKTFSQLKESKIKNEDEKQ